MFHAPQPRCRATWSWSDKPFIIGAIIRTEVRTLGGVGQLISKWHIRKSKEYLVTVYHQWMSEMGKNGYTQNITWNQWNLKDMKSGKLIFPLSEVCLFGLHLGPAGVGGHPIKFNGLKLSKTIGFWGPAIIKQNRIGWESLSLYHHLLVENWDLAMIIVTFH